ncbi:hypothetical protein PALU110988_16830 [Paenibacillus lupini]
MGQAVLEFSPEQPVFYPIISDQPGKQVRFVYVPRP